MNKNRRDFNKMMLASIGGLLAGAHLTSAHAGIAYAGGEKHVCKGMNAC